jgi:hypothetical protein
MKSFKLSLYFAALVTLIFVLAPCNTFAQDNPPIPPYRTGAPIPTLSMDATIANNISLADTIFENTDLSKIKLSDLPSLMPVSDQFSRVASTPKQKEKSAYSTGKVKNLKTSR